MPVILRGDYGYPPRGMPRDEAARYMGVEVVKFDDLVRAGVMPQAKLVGSLLVWDRLQLDGAFTALPESTPSRGNRQRASTLDNEPRAFSPKTLAERWQCSERHVRNMLKRGNLKSFLFGGTLLRIGRDEVERYEQSGGVHLGKRADKV